MLHTNISTLSVKHLFSIYIGVSLYIYLIQQILRYKMWEKSYLKRIFLNKNTTNNLIGKF